MPANDGHPQLRKRMTIILKFSRVEGHDRRDT